ncbi:hypothetical protein [Sphingomonas sp. HMP6]|uniref:hypothetical protein n=1 Tax=Sphingomonas sp. HMP6 TaxID=1517551 RepID=UPI001596F422|nr:hypothetical protein [Sphingomonas sp. HMP6]
MAKIQHDTPICAAAEHGVVVLDGPDGLATSLTPDAARQSAQRMTKAADLAESEPEAESP